jgi:hypothetical protein
VIQHFRGGRREKVFGKRGRGAAWTEILLWGVVITVVRVWGLVGFFFFFWKRILCEEGLK